MSNGFTLVTLLLIMSTSGFGLFVANPVKATPSDVEALRSEIVDLGWSVQITEGHYKFYTTVSFSEVWERVLLNITLQNIGDELDQILVTVNLNGDISEGVFKQYEEIRDSIGVRALAYQFELPQSLLLPLNHTPQTYYELEIVLNFDGGFSWNNPGINVRILEAAILGFQPSSATEWKVLPILGAERNFQIQPNVLKYQWSRTKLLGTGLLTVLIEDPASQMLETQVNLSVEGIGIDSVTIEGQTTHFDGNHQIGIAQNLVFNRQVPIYSIAIMISPEIIETTEPILVRMSIQISGQVGPRSDIFPFMELPPHPIPAPLMWLVLIIGLFGIPYWYVFQENLADTPEALLEIRTEKKV
ncbi:MAG: hypothetical protein ACFFE8_10365 [Candidatus Heimdallarchaeota archaeon]